MVWMMASEPIRNAPPESQPVMQQGGVSTESMQHFIESVNHSRSSVANGTGGQQLDDQFDEEGLKLGLGDFVFYSLLVAQASIFDWLTTLSTMIAVLAGLLFTIYLLVVYKRPLPALPLSISFGILFYLLSSLMLAPMMNAMVPCIAADTPINVAIHGTSFTYL